MNERRHHPRIRPTEKTTIKAGIHQARLIDLSLGGACFTLDRPLRPRSTQTISLVEGGSEIQLKAEVRRCRITRLSGPEAEQSPLFRVAVRFVEMPEERSRLLADNIERMSLGSSSGQRIGRRPARVA